MGTSAMAFPVEIFYKVSLKVIVTEEEPSCLSMMRVSTLEPQNADAETVTLKFLVLVGSGKFFRMSWTLSVEQVVTVND